MKAALVVYVGRGGLQPELRHSQASLYLLNGLFSFIQNSKINLKGKKKLV